MAKPSFSAADLECIRHERFHHPHPRVQLKMEVLWLLSQKLSQVRVAELAGVGRRTVERYLDEYRRGGLDAVRQVQFRKPSSALAEHAGTLEDYFLEHPPRSTAEAQAAIERLTGIRRGLTQVRAFLKKHSACVGARSARSPRRSTSSNRRGSWTKSCVPA